MNVLICQAGLMEAVAHSKGGTTAARTTSVQQEFPAQNKMIFLRLKSKFGY